LEMSDHWGNGRDAKNNGEKEGISFSCSKDSMKGGVLPGGGGPGWKDGGGGGWGSAAIACVQGKINRGERHDLGRGGQTTKLAN